MGFQASRQLRVELAALCAAGEVHQRPIPFA